MKANREVYNPAQPEPVADWYWPLSLSGESPLRGGSPERLEKPDGY